MQAKGVLSVFYMATPSHTIESVVLYHLKSRNSKPKNSWSQLQLCEKLSWTLSDLCLLICHNSTLNLQSLVKPVSMQDCKNSLIMQDSSVKMKYMFPVMAKAKLIRKQGMG